MRVDRLTQTASPGRFPHYVPTVLAGVSACVGVLPVREPTSGAVQLPLRSRFAAPRRSDRCDFLKHHRISMKIAFVTGHYLPFAGGIETHVEQIASRLATQGDGVTVLTQTDDPSWPSSEMIAGVQVRRFPVPVPSQHFAVSPSLGTGPDGAAPGMGRCACPRVP